MCISGVCLSCLYDITERQLHNNNARGINIQLHAHQLHINNCWGVNCVIIPAPTVTGELASQPWLATQLLMQCHRSVEPHSDILSIHKSYEGTLGTDLLELWCLKEPNMPQKWQLFAPPPEKETAEPRNLPSTPNDHSKTTSPKRPAQIDPKLGPKTTPPPKIHGAAKAGFWLQVQ